MSIEHLYQLYLQHPVVSTDSRRTPEGCMFFALKGESFNGNLFAKKALDAGAAIAVVDEPDVIKPGDKRFVLVDDVLTALQQLAAYHRQQFQGPVLQITGTNGKTTTKELIAAVLSKAYNVLYTQGNLNNHIGVPLTLLRLRTDKHQIAVIETGANHPGEIAFLTNIVKPTCGLVTNVGVAHIEGFGSFEGVKRTKGELYDYLLATAGCKLFLSVSNKDLSGMATERGVEKNDKRIIAYGQQGTDAQTLICEGAVKECTPFVTITWQQEGGAAHVTPTKLIGAYNLDNILAAIAVGLHFGVTPDDISQALTDYQPSLGRSEYRQTEYNRLIIDAYNANLTSMQAALTNFGNLSLPNKMVILGDMNELGTDSQYAHKQILDKVWSMPDIKEAWLVGKCWKKSLSNPERSNITYRLFANVEEVKAYINEHKPTDMTILVKGSNSIKLHQLPELL
ncbi:MAG: UDP-N-acetylmuramoyl-tripeptide--D-alanyl-D-alanine ligase [Bacteroidaceae bacterium]|nr:UDP-N-acetylmuramoyl-tripeptide--D-alanyl-D-alanine ligase [Bacteroidaceae bacterium]